MRSDSQVLRGKWVVERFEARPDWDGPYFGMDFGFSQDPTHAIEVSDAFLTEDIMSNKLAKIVKLVEIIPTHVASLNEDYLRLEEMALSAKQERVFREWLTKKIDAMYIWIAPEFRNGEFENKHWVK